MTTNVGWKIAAASVTGSSHFASNLPCQDGMIAKVMRDRSGDEVLLIVVSDGAGSAARAEIGSALVCSTVSEAVEVYLADGGFVDDIGTETIQTWLGMVREAIEERASGDFATLRDYAATLLLAIIGQSSSAVAQIGDGAIVVSDHGEWSWVHWPQRGEFANTTYFVTETNAKEQLAFDLCKGRIDEVAVFSDGIESLLLEYASQTVFSPFFDKMMPAVRTSTVLGLDTKLSEALAKYLNSPSICDRTDDDKTLVLASRAPSARSENDRTTLSSEGENVQS